MLVKTKLVKTRHARSSNFSGSVLLDSGISGKTYFKSFRKLMVLCMHDQIPGSRYRERPTLEMTEPGMTEPGKNRIRKGLSPRTSNPRFPVWFRARCMLSQNMQKMWQVSLEVSWDWNRFLLVDNCKNSLILDTLWILFEKFGWAMNFVFFVNDVFLIYVFYMLGT